MKYFLNFALFFVKENGITLCDCYNGCHFKAEEFTAENLYKKINSNYQLAYKKSLYL